MNEISPLAGEDAGLRPRDIGSPTLRCRTEAARERGCVGIDRADVRMKAVLQNLLVARIGIFADQREFCGYLVGAVGIEIASIFHKSNKENGVAPPPFPIGAKLVPTALRHPFHCQLLAFLRAVEQIEID